MKVVVLQVQSGERSPNADELRWWEPQHHVQRVQHEIVPKTVRSATLEADIDAVIEEGFEVFVISVTDEGLRNGLCTEASEYLKSLGKLTIGPSPSVLTMASEKIARSTVPDIYALALSIGQEIVVFQPMVKAPDGDYGDLSGGVAACEGIKQQFTHALDRIGFWSSRQLVRVHGNLVDGTLQHVAIEHNPHVFASALDSTDDLLVARSVPGGHAALLDFAISSQLASAEDMVLSQRFVEKYAAFAKDYDAEVRNFPYYGVLQNMVNNFDWSGSILDLGCGTGLLGEIIHDKGEPYSIVGVDLSPEMTAAPAIAKYYESPITMGTVQAAIMQPRMYDHIACFGTMTYLCPPDFTSLLSRMFMVARKSITFDIEDVSAEYFEKSAENETILPSYNHTSAFKRFDIPAGWKVVYEKYDLLYHDDLETGCDIFDTMIRIERI